MWGFVETADSRLCHNAAPTPACFRNDGILADNTRQLAPPSLAAQQSPSFRKRLERRAPGRAVLSLWEDRAVTARLKGRRRAALRVVGDLKEWAFEDSRVQGLVLVGSYARGAERMASDVDLVILTNDPDALADSSWFSIRRPGSRLVRSRRWGPIRERRYRLRCGLLVELDFAPLDWAAVPLDAGTRRVLSDGHLIIYDTGLLEAASTASR